MTIKVKEFMALYGIVDIYMRMLNVGELKRIMGFPSDYVLVGTQAEQKKYIGNAVEVGMARVLCEALAQRIMALDKKYITGETFDQVCDRYRSLHDDWDNLSYEEKRDRINRFRCAYSSIPIRPSLHK